MHVFFNHLTTCSIMFMVWARTLKNLSRRMKVTIFLLILVVMVLLQPGVCHSNNHDHSHGHNHEEASFKYSREANDAHRHKLNLRKETLKSEDVVDVWLYSMGSTLLISAAPFLILFIIPLDNSDSMRPRLKILLAFASGGLLGDAFLHLIPHATIHHQQHSYDEHQQAGNGHNQHSHNEEDNHIHSHDITVGLWVLCGIIAFLTVEKVVRLLNSGKGHIHCHANSSQGLQNLKNESIKANNNGDVDITAYLNLAADFAHNFTDGLAIGASYLAGNSIGIVTTITILLHEVPHEIGDFAILIKSGCSRRKAIMLQLLTAIGALSGNAVSLIGVGVNSEAVPWVLPFTAGGFIYIATVSVLPELLEETTKLSQSIKEIAALLFGVVIMVIIARFE